MESDQPLAVEFEFYDDAGEMVSSESVSLPIPEKETESQFSVTTESSVPISGVAYKIADASQQTAGGQD